MEIAFKNIAYHDQTINFSLNSNEIIGITGKQTEELLSLIALYNFPEGTILYNNIKLDKNNRNEYFRKISYVKAEFEKSPYINTVKETMEFVIEYYRLQIKDINKKMKDSLKIVGLEDIYMDRLLSTLSKSELKLIQIAISLLSNPEVLILEEPFVDLDNKNEKRIYMLLLRLKEQYHKLIIIGSEDSNMLHKYTTKMLFIKNGEILLEGETQVVYQRVDFLKRNGFAIPEITMLTYKANKEKNANIDYHKDIRDIIKDIYKHV